VGKNKLYSILCFLSLLSCQNIKTIKQDVNDNQRLQFELGNSQKLILNNFKIQLPKLNYDFNSC
jgi:hypothetical protein